MPYFSFLNDDANVMHVLAHRKSWSVPFEKALNEVMRGPSELTEETRELIAAYVSGLNACGFCFGSHAATAEAFGFDATLFEGMIADLETSGVEEKLKPLLAYCRTLTLEPSKVTQSQVDAARDAGWSEEAIHEASLVTAMFNFMNRMVDGHGVQPLTKEGAEFAGAMLYSAGYDMLKGM